MSIEEIKINDLLDSNGNQFNIHQAYSYSEDKWRYTMIGPLEDIKKCVDENIEFSDEHWLKELRSLNTLYRVRCILKSLKKNQFVQSIGVIRKDGKLYLKDGRHRTWAAILNGQETIKAEIVDR